MMNKIVWIISISAVKYLWYISLRGAAELLPLQELISLQSHEGL